MSLFGFEQGPIRPPSEAMSLLVRVSRNCPWNRCAFCPVYKGGEGYSKRTVAEIHADLDAMKELHGSRPRTVFLQDADPLLTRPDDMIEVLRGVRERFPEVRRITTYARSRTLSRRSLDDHDRLLAMCDAVLALPEEDRVLFVLGRRTGHLGRLPDLERPEVRDALTRLRSALIPEGGDAEEAFQELRRRWL